MCIVFCILYPDWKRGAIACNRTIIPGIDDARDLTSMNDWKRATRFLLLGYSAATLGGVILYYRASDTVMWFFTMSVMPALYLVLAYKYFRKNLADPAPFFDRDLFSLAAYWLLLSYFLDALVYVFLAPWSLGSSPNWTFFRDQSPWIWINYFTLAVIVVVAKWFYSRKRVPQMNTEKGIRFTDGH